MRLTVNYRGPGLAMDCKTPEGALITFDSASSGTYGGSPVQHLLSALGACALMDVETILRKKRLTYTNLRVECIGARPDDVVPKPLLDAKLVFSVEGDVPAKAFDDAVRLSVEKYCSVGATLARATPVSYEAKVNPA